MNVLGQGWEHFDLSTECIFAAYIWYEVDLISLVGECEWRVVLANRTIITAQNLKDRGTTKYKRMTRNESHLPWLYLTAG